LEQHTGFAQQEKEGTQEAQEAQKNPVGYFTSCASCASCVPFPSQLA
jgi:hypothetical protein